MLKLSCNFMNQIKSYTNNQTKSSTFNSITSPSPLTVIQCMNSLLVFIIKETTSQCHSLKTRNQVFFQDKVNTQNIYSTPLCISNQIISLKHHSLRTACGRGRRYYVRDKGGDRGREPSHSYGLYITFVNVETHPKVMKYWTPKNTRLWMILFLINQSSNGNTK